MDRNATMRAAGKPTRTEKEASLRDCLVIADPVDFIRDDIKQQCRQSRPPPDGTRTPILPDGSVKELFTVELRKSRITKLKESFFLHQSKKVGKTFPTHSKPDEVTNVSRTFGRPSPTWESVYETIMPPKSRDQVNQEHGVFNKGQANRKWVLSGDGS